jgi:serine phosphatase RsbU (regulator of sigma subunit)
MSVSVSVAEAEAAKESFGCECVCKEHAREAELIQSSLLPTTGFCHESVEIAFRLMPFSYVGGDFADFFRLPDGLIGIYLGDVGGRACRRPCTAPW